MHKLVLQDYTIALLSVCVYKITISFYAAHIRTLDKLARIGRGRHSGNFQRVF